MPETRKAPKVLSIYEYDDYRGYLIEAISSAPRGGRGLKAALANAVGCQPTYVSAVLKGSAHFSLEQAEKLNAFLGHDGNESHYWLLLVQHARASTPSLRRYFGGLLVEERKKAVHLKHRLRVADPLSDSARQTYFSAWYFAAVHAVVSIPGCDTADAIARLLNLDRSLVTQVVAFLVGEGLLGRTGMRLAPGLRRIHLPHDSPLISKHHANWRLHALTSLNQSPVTSSPDRLHYSSVAALSAKEALRIRRQLMEEIERVKGLIAESPEEAAYCFSLDFFPLASP